MTEKILGINYGMIHTAAKKCYIPTLRVYICHLALNSETIQRRFMPQQKKNMSKHCERE